MTEESTMLPFIGGFSESELKVLRKASLKRRIHTRVFIYGFGIVTFGTILLTFSWNLLLFSAVSWLIINVAVGVGHHRLLTHGGFKTKRWVAYTLVAIAGLALQGGHIHWVAVHRKHHKFTDNEGDPHSPRFKGGLWAQWYWMMSENVYLDYDPDLKTKYAPDLMKDRGHRILQNFWWTPALFMGILYFLIGYQTDVLTGLTYVSWGSIVHVFIGWNITWMVNSVAHIRKFGYRNFDTPDDSINCWWLAILTFGEGWHNNHHKYPWSARHGLKKREWDLNYWTILLLKKLGLAWDLRVAEIKRS